MNTDAVAESNQSTGVTDLCVDQWDAYPVIMEQHAALSPVLVQLLWEKRGNDGRFIKDLKPFV